MTTKAEYTAFATEMFTAVQEYPKFTVLSKTLEKFPNLYPHQIEILETWIEELFDEYESMYGN